ncbi:hypothetical protein FB451DRAFT_661717 [Mycena latifolia]|nr:hypothetical protein FB451DRAFT_661717 [Mycena latifolia]
MLSLAGIPTGGGGAESRTRDSYQAADEALAKALRRQMAAEGIVRVNETLRETKGVPHLRALQSQARVHRLRLIPEGAVSRRSRELTRRLSVGGMQALCGLRSRRTGRRWRSWASALREDGDRATTIKRAAVLSLGDAAPRLKRAKSICVRKQGSRGGHTLERIASTCPRTETQTASGELDVPRPRSGEGAHTKLASKSSG